MKKLVIVESPTKAKTLSRFLGSEYDIKFSMGHIMDLPKSTLGVDIKNNFKPELEVVMDKKPILADLKKAAKTSKEVILATDPDREGEAIASNIRDTLIEDKDLKGLTFSRIEFHEITKEAIENAVVSPRSIDDNLVNAQVARRILDRLVGYKISPVLWRKVRRGLSAGRVQSVALRLIAEREKEINQFKKNVYFTIHAQLKKQNEKSNSTEFELFLINDEKIETQTKHELYDGTYTVTGTTIASKQKADDILEEIKTPEYKVTDVNKKETYRSPNAPFTTSTLQQEASRKFGYPGRRTMSLAQKLYEEGFITYHRTDSVTLAKSAIKSIREHIEKNFSPKYLSQTERTFTTKQKSAQEAHEGIRPTNVDTSQDKIKSALGPDCVKLYDLIYKRAVASQMANSIVDSTGVIVTAKGKNLYSFRANGSVLKFDGFLKLYPQALTEKQLPEFSVSEILHLVKSFDVEHTTTPPPRYNDASLIGKLEEKGIGRPSTYASIISVITDRAYVERSEKRFEPTSVGIAVNDFLVKNFSAIDDIPFTAKMEDELDLVAEGKSKWQEMLKEFYEPFEKSLSVVDKADRVKIETEKTDEKCPECSSDLVIRVGRFGKFFSCSTFPACKFTKQYMEKTEISCPKDKGEVIIKKTRTGRKFYGCSNYPKCDFAAWKLEDIKGHKSSKSPEKSSEAASTS